MISSDYVRTFAANEVIFEEGSVGEHLYVVVKGHVSITRRLDGRDVAIATFGSGEFFGEMAVIEEAPRFASARALEPGTEVALINQAQFIYLVSHQPVFALMVLEALSHRLRETTVRGFAAAVEHAAVTAGSGGIAP